MLIQDISGPLIIAIVPICMLQDERQVGAAINVRYRFEIKDIAVVIQARSSPDESLDKMLCKSVFQLQLLLFFTIFGLWQITITASKVNVHHLHRIYRARLGTASTASSEALGQSRHKAQRTSSPDLRSRGHSR